MSVTALRQLLLQAVMLSQAICCSMTLLLLLLLLSHCDSTANLYYCLPCSCCHIPNSTARLPFAVACHVGDGVFIGEISRPILLVRAMLLLPCHPLNCQATDCSCLPCWHCPRLLAGVLCCLPCWRAAMLLDEMLV
jgi:hypothetical protein